MIWKDLKFSISGGVIDEDDFSARMKDQVELFNLAAGYDRYSAKIILKNIKGPIAAEKIEREHILNFEKNLVKNLEGIEKRSKKNNFLSPLNILILYLVT